MKQNSAPTQETFRRFLHWLDEGVDSGGERYLEMRRWLAFYFDRTPEQVKKLDQSSAVTMPYPIWHQRQFRERNPFSTRV